MSTNFFIEVDIATFVVLEKTSTSAEDKSRDKNYETKIKRFEQDATSYDKSGELEKALETYYNILGYYYEIDNKEKIIDTLVEIAKLYKHKGLDEKAIQNLYQALQIVNANAPASLKKGIIYYELARVYHDEGKLTKAIEYWKYSIPIFEEFSRVFEVAMANRYIGYSLRDINEYNESLVYLQKALPVFKKVENPLYAANTSNAIGSVYQIQEEFELAIDYFSQALEMYRKSNNPYDSLTTLLSMSICLNEMKEDQKAIATYLRALFLIIQNPSMIHDFDISRLPEDFLDNEKLQNIISRRRKDAERKIDEAQDIETLVKLKLDYTSLLKIDGDYDNAIEIYTRLHEKYHDRISVTQEARIHHNLGLLHFERGEFTNSLKEFQEARQLYEKEGMVNDSIYSILGMSETYLRLGEPDNALEILSESIQLFTDQSGALLKSMVYNALGEIYQHKGILERSLEMFLISLDLIERTSNPLNEANALYHVGNIYYLMKDYDEAVDKYKRALQKFDLMLPTVEKAKTLTGLGNIAMIHDDEQKAFEYYEQALRIHEEHSIDQTYTLNNLTDLYIKKKNYDEAINNAMQSLAILRDNPNPYLKAIPLKKLAKIFFEKGDVKKAYEFAAEAAEIWKTSPNPNDIKKPLDLIDTYLPKKALSLALNSALGCNWILTKYQQQINEGNYHNAEIWKYMKMAASNFWSEADQLKRLGKLEESYFRKNWKLAHFLNETKRKITPETTVNFLFGANDLNDKEEYLRDTQTDLDPMWFIEVPAFLDHGKGFMKIRLNNLVKSLGSYVSIPSIEEPNPPVRRIKLKMETQWLQKLEIDHLFYPNTDTEYRKYSNNPESTWLSDVVIMELGDHTKKVDKIELTFTIEVFFDEESDKPDLISTTSTRSIPVVRKRNFERLEKVKENHNNFLAILLAVWSIILSIGSYALEADISQVSPFIRNNYLTIIITLLSITGISLFFGLWLIKSVDHWKRIIGFEKLSEDRPAFQYELEDDEDSIYM